MTNEQTRASIGAEVRRGAEALESADILLNAGKYADAVSRAYYAAYHYARALLLSAGEEPRTHGGLDRLLQRDFVRTGQLEAKDARLLARLMAFRQSADYTRRVRFHRCNRARRGRCCQDVRRGGAGAAGARRLVERRVVPSIA